VWYLNRTTGANGAAQVSLVPFKSAFWGPEGGLTLNPQQILFTAPLAKSSQLVTEFENPSAAQQQQGQQAPDAPAANPPSTPSSSAPAAH